MRNDKRFIPGEEVAHVTRWDFQAVDTASQLLAAQVRTREDADVKVAFESGQQAGYAQGFAQGQAQAALQGQQAMAEYIAHQGQQAAQQFGQLFVSTEAGLAQAQQAMAQGVLELACELARQIVRNELSLNPNALQPVIREALGLLIADSKTALVRLNPLDLEVLEDVLRAEFSNLSLTFLADPRVNRGGCLVEAAGMVVDGSLERRWERALATLGLELPWQEFGDEQ